VEILTCLLTYEDCTDEGKQINSQNISKCSCM